MMPWRGGGRSTLFSECKVRPVFLFPLSCIGSGGPFCCTAPPGPFFVGGMRHVDLGNSDAWLPACGAYGCGAQLMWTMLVSHAVF